MMLQDVSCVVLTEQFEGDVAVFIQDAVARGATFEYVSGTRHDVTGEPGIQVLLHAPPGTLLRFQDDAPTDTFGFIFALPLFRHLSRSERYRLLSMPQATNGLLRAIREDGLYLVPDQWFTSNPLD